MKKVTRQILFLGKFLLLVLLLNVIRYVAGAPLEIPLVLGGLFGEMHKCDSYFKTQFTTEDWVTSYLYNFMMWLTITWIFVKCEKSFRGGCILKSLQVYVLMLLFFASVSAIYMNHYSHPKLFYVYNILESVLVYPLVAVANGLIYPRLFSRRPEGIPRHRSSPLRVRTKHVQGVYSE